VKARRNGAVFPNEPARAPVRHRDLFVAVIVASPSGGFLAATSLRPANPGTPHSTGPCFR
jgi:hypothetical protein